MAEDQEASTAATAKDLQHHGSADAAARYAIGEELFRPGVWETPIGSRDAESDRAHDGLQVISDVDLDKVIAMATFAGDPDDDSDGPSREEATRVAMLRRLRRDPRLRYRPHAYGDVAMLARLSQLAEDAPNFADATALVWRTALLSKTARMPLRLPPIVLCGPPGAGKTYYAKRLGTALAAAVTEVSGTLLTDRGAISGLGPAWRGARMGCVAKSLLASRQALTVIVIDEVEKMCGLLAEDKPLETMLPLLEQETARAFVDDYLGVAIRADIASWVMTANEVDSLPSPFRDRVLVLDVPDLTRDQRDHVSRRIFADVNALHGGAFELPDEDAVRALAGLRSRRVKAIVIQAMGYAAAAGRWRVTAEDIASAARLVIGQPRRSQVGFCFSPD